MARHRLDDGDNGKKWGGPDLMLDERGDTGGHTRAATEIQRHSKETTEQRQDDQPARR